MAPSEVSATPPPPRRAAWKRLAGRVGWLLFDDEKVTVCPDTRPVIQAEAYLLCYTRAPRAVDSGTPMVGE